jgi:rhodanese-related sulfurtransferase
MTSVRTCPVEELKTRLESSSIAVVDVREFPEYAESHIRGARLVPLGQLRQEPNLVGDGGEVYLVCRSGRRAREAAALLSEGRSARPVVVEGGMEAWKQAGYPVCREKGPISLERQVRIAAGSLVLAGLLVPGLSFLPYLVGAGLIFAGITDWCGMGMLLARLPWNRPKPQPAVTAR